LRRGTFGGKRRQRGFRKKQVSGPNGRRPAPAEGAGLHEDLVLRFLNGHDQEPWSLNGIADGLDLPRKYRKMLGGLLASLCRQNLVECTAGNRYRLQSSPELVQGVLTMNPRGFGFVTPTNPPPGLRTDRDLFIPARDLAAAMHGDRVLVRVTGGRRDRLEARVIAVLQRAAEKLVGIYTTLSRNYGLVTPEDDRYPFVIEIPINLAAEAREGEAVVAEITEFPPDGQRPRGRISEVLGDPEDMLVQTEMTVRVFGLPNRFEAEVLREVAALSDRVEVAPGRVDLRAVPHVTIDGETARDFDDAVAVEKTKAGYRLYVSIADVSHYVRPGTAVDREAYLRGTSVYFPNMVLPMLPERLSNDLCSLVPDQDRLAFTAVLDFDAAGQRQHASFTRSVIRSRYRLTYTKVKLMLADNDPELRGQYAAVVADLELMGELSRKLEERRMARGSIGFEIPEAVVELDEQGKIGAIRRMERNLAHKLIEEFMLAANEAVAKTLADRKKPTLYRVHETPEAEKVEAFSEFAASLGLAIPRGERNPAWFGKVLALVAGSPREYIVSNLLLRSMKQARYAPENVGHFGLAAAYYTHFTSPIRRYPDLLVHRHLQAVLTGKGDERQMDLVEAGEFLSTRERKAEKAEREVVEKMKVRYMAERVGESFEGIISGVTAFGLFIELLETFISGAVPIEQMLDDYFRLDEKNHRLIGDRTNRIYQLGDLVRVTVTDVDLRRRRVNFALR